MPQVRILSTAPIRVQLKRFLIVAASLVLVFGGFWVLLTINADHPYQPLKEVGNANGKIDSYDVEFEADQVFGNMNGILECSEIATAREAYRLRSWFVESTEHSKTRAQFTSLYARAYTVLWRHGCTQGTNGISYSM